MMAKKLAKRTLRAPPKAQKPTRRAALEVVTPALPGAADARVLDRLWGTIMSRRTADPATSHSARLLARGTAKVAQKFGEEAVECVIEAVAGHRDALVCESADVLYHLLVVWADAGLRPEQIWEELMRREGVSGIAEKAARKPLFAGMTTNKIP